MRKLTLSLLSIMCCAIVFGQQNISIHQQQQEYYNAQGKSTSYYEHLPYVATPARAKANCNLDQVVYGWHPYWVGSSYNNYDWDLLSHFSFFSYEVDEDDGNASTTHGWSTSAAVDAALASGNTKVTLCVTLFGGSRLTTFFSSSTSQQTLITNLINLVQSRGAHGVNIDFEGLPSSQRTNFANFMVDLSTQMKAAIPGSEISTVLYAVDWNNVFDFSIMEPAVDHYIVMGYGYYYTGSSNAGPTDPLYHFGTNYNYSLSRTITYYLDEGCPKDKLIMGLPYYGYEWPTSTTSIPGASTGSGSSRTFAYVNNNTSGNYSQANHQFDDDSYTDVFVFDDGGQTRQCFITLEDGFKKRLDHIRKTGIGGIGIWALGYDNGYSEFWDGLDDFFTECYADSCSGIIHDFGGPYKDYYDNEDYTWTVSPPGAQSIDVSFREFDVETNFDYLYIYDGGSTSASQIAGSPFTGTTLPASFTSSTGELTFRFTSDGATNNAGFIADYSCNIDNVPPVTAITTTGNWKTADFDATFTDTDNNNVINQFYQVADNNGTEWRSNVDNGFLNDDFETALNTEWTVETGTWNITSNALNQTDEASSNTNLYTDLSQGNANAYLYHWTGQINGAGTNRRAGIHYFSDDATQTNRGNSYFVYYRTDTDKCQLYKVVNDSWTLESETDISLDPNVTYDFKIMFNPQNGEHKVFLDDQLVLDFTDGTPHQSGAYLSLRTGSANVIYDNFKVYKSRGGLETITLGNTSTDIRFENQNPTSPSGKITSLVLDDANNWSASVEEMENVDWTAPVMLGVSDGLTADIDTFSTVDQISGNWMNITDANSDIAMYSYAVGTSAGTDNIVSWRTNGTSTSFTETGLSLINNTIYYVSVKATNGAGLESSVISSDGQKLVIPVIDAPTAANDVEYCLGDNIATLTASASNGGSLTWYNDAALSNVVGTGATYAPGSISVTTSYYVTETINTDESLPDTVIVTINSLPVANAGADQQICTGTSAVVNATGGTTYAWNNGLGLGASHVVSPSNPTTYTVTVTDGNGCEDVDNVFISFVASPIINTSNMVINPTACGGATGSITGVTASGTGSITYQWKNANGTVIGSSANVSNLALGNYYLVVMDDNCVDSSGFFAVSQSGAPTAPLASSPSAYCEGETINSLTASGSGGTITWYSDAALTTAITTGSTYSPAPISTTSYYVTENQGGCESQATTVTITIVPNPIADFVANTTTVYLPNADVQFTNNAQNYTSSFWNFGDNITSTDENPLHTYSDTGFYSVTLIVSNNTCTNNDVEEKVAYIHVVDTTTAVSADFEVNNAVHCLGESVNFTNLSVGASSYLWTIDGVLVSTNTNLQYNFAQSGTYAVELEAIGSNGSDIYTNQVTVTVLNVPVASFYSADTVLTLPNTVANFVNTSSNYTSSSWMFGDGGTSVDNNPWHEYQAVGAYSVELLVTNECGTSSVAEMNYVNVSDGVEAPAAAFLMSNTEVCEGDMITLNNLSQNATNYQWTMTGGTPSTSTAMNPQVTFTSAGTYTIELTSSNSAGSAIESQSIVINAAPIADFYAVDTIVSVTNGVVGFTNMSQNATNYWWEFGDGNSSTMDNAWNDYNSQGIFSVYLIADNPYCSADTLSREQYITVTTGVGIEENETNLNVMAYPNPFNEQIVVTSKLNLKGATIKLYDLSGKLIMKEFNSNNQYLIELNTKNIAKGLYLLELSNSDYLYSLKLTKN